MFKKKIILLQLIGVIDYIKDKKKDSISILGYGKLGKELYLKLKDTDSNIYIISRPKPMIYDDKLSDFYPLDTKNILHVFSISDIVVNTIPHNIIPEDIFTLNHIPYILDIASAPYGMSQDIVDKHEKDFNYEIYSNIPSKFAPKEASDILLKTLKKVMNDKL